MTESLSSVRHVALKGHKISRVGNCLRFHLGQFERFVPIPGMTFSNRPTRASSSLSLLHLKKGVCTSSET